MFSCEEAPTGGHRPSLTCCIPIGCQNLPPCRLQDVEVEQPLAAHTPAGSVRQPAFPGTTTPLSSRAGAPALAAGSGGAAGRPTEANAGPAGRLTLFTSLIAPLGARRLLFRRCPLADLCQHRWGAAAGGAQGGGVGAIASGRDWTLARRAVFVCRWPLHGMCPLAGITRSI